MAAIQGNLADGKPMQVGGWYNGQQWNGSTLSAPGIQSNGQAVSQEVAAQTNPNNVAYLAGRGAPLPSNNNPQPQNGGGGGGGMGMPNQPAIPNLQSIYDTAFTNNPDVVQTNKDIADLNSQLTTRQKALADAQKEINDNPFYAEATRTGKLQKLTDSANNDMTVLNNQLTQKQQALAQKQADAERQVNLSQGQYTLENEAWKQNLDEFNTLLSAGGLTGASPQTLAQLSGATGLSYDMLSGIQQSQQQKNTQIIQSTDNAGNLTLAAVDSATGKILNTETLGGVGKAKGGTGGKTGEVDANGLTQQDYISYLNNDIANGVTLKSLINHYGIQNKVLPIDTIYQAYANGSKFGSPKETLSQVKSGQYADDKGFVSKTKKVIN